MRLTSMRAALPPMLQGSCSQEKGPSFFRAEQLGSKAGTSGSIWFLVSDVTQRHRCVILEFDKNAPGGRRGAAFAPVRNESLVQGGIMVGWLKGIAVAGLLGLGATLLMDGGPTPSRESSTIGSCSDNRRPSTGPRRRWARHAGRHSRLLQRGKCGRRN
jgi:hypothetical protein